MADQLPDEKSAIRLFSFALAFFYIAPVIFLCCYCLIYDAPASAISSHLLLVGILLIGVTGLRVIITSIAPDGRKALVFSTAVVALSTSALIVFYGLVVVGLQSWGRVISIDLIGAYLNHANEFISVLGYSRWVLVGAFSIFFCGYCISIFTYLKFFDWTQPFCKGLSGLTTTSSGIMLIVIALIFAIELPRRNWGGIGEPFSLSLFPESGRTNFQAHTINNLRASKIDATENLFRTAYKAARLENPRNVILIVVDALRTDHLALFGYAKPTSPNLIGFKNDGRLRLAESAVSVCSESSCGIRAISSSRYVDGQANRPITLHETLGWHGYSVNFLLSGDHTNFYGLKQFYQPYENYFDSTTQSVRYANDDRIITDVVSKMEPWNGEPTMFHFHLMSTHQAGKRLDETIEFGNSENYTKFGLMRSSKGLEEKAVNFYDRGVLQSDNFIGEILKNLKSKGYLKNALVIVTGDHGESLGEKNYYGHSHVVWEPVLRVPFILLTFGKSDVQLGKKNTLVSQVDIAPTVLFELGIPIPPTWEGKPLQISQGQKIVYFQQAQLLGLTDARLEGKIYKHWFDIKTGQKFTFELLTDPGEQNNLTNTLPEALTHEWQRLLLRRSASLEP